MFLRMLSYYISWHMKQALAPILFYDNDKPAARPNAPTPSPPPNVPIRHWPKPRAKRTDDDTPQFHQPARQPGHHLRQPDSAGRQHANVHHHHPLTPRGNAKSSNYSPSHTATATRSH